jgi:hypothetical protein
MTVPAPETLKAEAMVYLSILATIESAARWTSLPIVSPITSEQHLSLIGDRAIHGFG